MVQNLKHFAPVGALDAGFFKAPGTGMQTPFITFIYNLKNPEEDDGHHGIGQVNLRACACVYHVCHRYSLRSLYPRREQVRPSHGCGPHSLQRVPVGLPEPHNARAKGVRRQHSGDKTRHQSGRRSRAQPQPRRDVPGEHEDSMPAASAAGPEQRWTKRQGRDRDAAPNQQPASLGVIA
eukprot:3180010-Pleurochrysis_carterae.AAC.1